MWGLPQNMSSLPELETIPITLESKLGSDFDLEGGNIMRSFRSSILVVNKSSQHCTSFDFVLVVICALQSLVNICCLINYLNFFLPFIIALLFQVYVYACKAFLPILNKKSCVLSVKLSKNLTALGLD